MTEILCYVCYSNPGEADLNIFSIESEHSKTLIYKFLEQFLSLEDDQLLKEPGKDHERYICCLNCLDKVNEYDWGITVAEKAQLELISLLDGREAKTASIEEESNEEVCVYLANYYK